MHRLKASCLVTLLLGACGANEIEQAKDAVSYQLIDPSSAQFREVVANNGVVCGQVNGKNRLGAFVGFRNFYAVKKADGNFHTVLDDPSLRKLMPKSEKRFTENVMAGMEATCAGDKGAERQAQIAEMDTLCDGGKNKDACELAQEMRETPILDLD